MTLQLKTIPAGGHILLFPTSNSDAKTGYVYEAHIRFESVTESGILLKSNSPEITINPFTKPFYASGVIKHVLSGQKTAVGMSPPCPIWLKIIRLHFFLCR